MGQVSAGWSCCSRGARRRPPAVTCRALHAPRHPRHRGLRAGGGDPLRRPDVGSPSHRRRARRLGEARLRPERPADRHGLPGSGDRSAPKSPTDSSRSAAPSTCPASSSLATSWPHGCAYNNSRCAPPTHTHDRPGHWPTAPAAAARHAATALGLFTPRPGRRRHGRLRMLDEVEELDWPWWGREAMLATVRMTLLAALGCLRGRGAAPGARRNGEPSDGCRRRALVSSHDLGHQPFSPGAPVARTGHGWRAAASTPRRRLRWVIRTTSPRRTSAAPGLRMIASTGSFDAGPVDGYLADLAAALGRVGDERRHRDLLAHLMAREGLAA